MSLVHLFPFDRSVLQIMQFLDFGEFTKVFDLLHASKLVMMRKRKDAIDPDHSVCSIDPHTHVNIDEIQHQGHCVSPGLWY